MSADSQNLNVSYLLSDIYVLLVESMNNIYSVCIWEWAMQDWNITREFFYSVFWTCE